MASTKCQEYFSCVGPGLDNMCLTFLADIGMVHNKLLSRILDLSYRLSIFHKFELLLRA